MEVAGKQARSFGAISSEEDVVKLGKNGTEASQENGRSNKA
jgi:hypothetical protein